MASRKQRALWGLAAAFLLGAASAWWFFGRSAPGQAPAESWSVAKPRPSPSAGLGTAPQPRPAPAARLGIVLDDWGYHTKLLPRLSAFPGRLTVAVLPGLDHSRECAQAAHAAGHEVILHLPVQPEGNLPLVPGTLMVGMGEAEVAALCERHAATVPYMAGLNNHEGSRGSADIKLMGAVARWLKGRGGYFLDSLTTPKSVIPQAARAAGLPWARRKVFLDNVDTLAAVEAEAERALKAALKDGSCIAIGHPRANTLAALEKLAPRLKALGVELVPASALVK